MSQSIPRVTINRASDAQFEGDGLRDNFVYRDLGIKRATGGKVGAHVIRVVRPMTEAHGRHRHGLDFQMVFVLKGH